MTDRRWVRVQDELARLRRIEAALKEQDFPYYVAPYIYPDGEIEDHHCTCLATTLAPVSCAGTPCSSYN